jgi:hypothetical protein
VEIFKEKNFLFVRLIVRKKLFSHKKKNSNNEKFFSALITSLFSELMQSLHKNFYIESYFGNYIALQSHH